MTRYNYPACNDFTVRVDEAWRDEAEAAFDAHLSQHSVMALAAAVGMTGRELIRSVRAEQRAPKPRPPKPCPKVGFPKPGRHTLARVEARVVGLGG